MLNWFRFAVFVFAFIEDYCQKNIGKTSLRDFNQQFAKINLLLWKKLYCIQPVWAAKLDTFYAIYVVLTKKMAQK